MNSATKLAVHHPMPADRNPQAFPVLSDEFIARLARCADPPQVVRAGTVLVQQGEPMNQFILGSRSLRP